MFGFFSGSSSKKRYPNGNRGGSYYQRGGGIFGKFGSFSGSSSGRRFYNNGYGQQGYPQGGNYQQYILREIIISKITLSKAALSSRFRKILKVPPFARSAAVQYLPDQSFAFPAAPRLRAQHFAQDAEGLCRPAQSSVRNAVHRRIDDDQKADRCIHRGVTSRRRTLRCLLFGERQRRTAGRAKKVSAAYVEEKSGR